MRVDPGVLIAAEIRKVRAPEEVEYLASYRHKRGPVVSGQGQEDGARPISSLATDH